MPREKKDTNMVGGITDLNSILKAVRKDFGEESVMTD